MLKNKITRLVLALCLISSILLSASACALVDKTKGWVDQISGKVDETPVVDETPAVYETPAVDEKGIPKEISDCIKTAYVNHVNERFASYSDEYKIAVEDVEILCYMGQYGDSYVAMIKKDQRQTQSAHTPIGGFGFHGQQIVSVYNNGKYYDLIEAYESGMINDEQLEIIYELERAYMNIYYEAEVGSQNKPCLLY